MYNIIWEIAKKVFGISSTQTSPTSKNDNVSIIIGSNNSSDQKRSNTIIISGLTLAIVGLLSYGLYRSYKEQKEALRPRVEDAEDPCLEILRSELKREVFLGFKDKAAYSENEIKLYYEQEKRDLLQDIREGIKIGVGLEVAFKLRSFFKINYENQQSPYKNDEDFLKKYVFWNGIAALGGHPYSQFSVYEHFKIGDKIIGQNVDAALGWLKIGANAGDMDSLLKLAAHYAYGIGIRQDMEKGEKLFRKAKEKFDNDPKRYGEHRKIIEAFMKETYPQPSGVRQEKKEEKSNHSHLCPS